MLLLLLLLIILLYEYNATLLCLIYFNVKIDVSYDRRLLCLIPLSPAGLALRPFADIVRPGIFPAPPSSGHPVVCLVRHKFGEISHR